MTGPKPCEECGKPMSAAAVACPHCGTRQAGRDPLPEHERPAPGPMAKAKLSSEEMAAMLAIDSVKSPKVESGPGLFSVLLLPHPMTSGVARILDVLLTIVAHAADGRRHRAPDALRRPASHLRRRHSSAQRPGRAHRRGLRGHPRIASAFLSLGVLFPLPIDVPPLVMAATGSAALVARAFVRTAAEK